MNPLRANSNNPLLRYDLGLHAAGCAVFVLVLGTFYWQGFSMLAEQDAEQQIVAESLERFIAQRPALVKKHTAAKQLLETQQGRFAELLTNIPNAPQEDNFLRQLAELSAATGLEIRQFTPGATTSLGNFASMQIDVSAQASYESLCRFLEGVVEMPRLCEVTSLQVEAGDPSAARYAVSFSLRIYFAPVAAAASEAPRA
jgi:Tfp pilus assembly protein PilO